LGAYTGWERANWYARVGDDTSDAGAQTWARKGAWFEAVRAEVQAVRDAAGILDLPGFSRFVLSGLGASAWLARQISGKLPNIGRLGLAYFADDLGRIITEMSVARLGEDEILLITAATAQSHDGEWLQRHLTAGLLLQDVTESWSAQIITGPKSREILAKVTDADLSKPWLTFQDAQVAGQGAFLMRVSFAGELGWEIHSKYAKTQSIYEAVIAAGGPLGLKPFGMFALNSLRIEKGYRVWKGDLSTDYSLL
jgi:dimethylglycine dehydrogenase